MKPLIHAHYTKAKKINYNTIGINGEKLNHCNQGFNTKQGLLKNLRATYGKGVEVLIKWFATSRSKVVAKEERVTL